MYDVIWAFSSAIDSQTEHAREVCKVNQTSPIGGSCLILSVAFFNLLEMACAVKDS